MRRLLLLAVVLAACDDGLPAVARGGTVDAPLAEIVVEIGDREPGCESGHMTPCQHRPAANMRVEVIVDGGEPVRLEQDRPGTYRAPFRQGPGPYTLLVDGEPSFDGELPEPISFT